MTNASGSAAGINTFDEFGAPAATNLGRFSFTGQIWLPEVELYHFKARAYSPELGRFLQTDPVGYEQGPNLYAYVENDPINNTDPTGTSIWTKLIKLGKALWKGGDMADEFADNIQDAATIFNPSASLVEKSVAVVSLASEVLPVSVSDAKDAGRIVANVVEKFDDKAKIAVKKGSANGPRAGKDHTRAAKRNARDENRNSNNGDLICPDCKKRMNTPIQSKRGVPVDRDAAVGAHIHAKSKGGNGATADDLSNIEAKCWECNAIEGPKVP